MTVSPNNASLAVGREVMDRALAAPTGVRIFFAVGEKWGDEHATANHAKRLQTACHQARTAQRRANKRVFADDGAQLPDGGTGAGHKGHDPDALRTDYDALTTHIETVYGPSRPADPANGLMDSSSAVIGHALIVARPNLSALDLTEF